MTQQHVLLDVQNSAAPESDGPLRLRLKPKSPTSGYVDGAWWPRSDDLAAELPDLLAVLAIRLGPINRVLYRFGEWSTPPRKLVINYDLVRLDGYRLQPPATIEVQGFNRGRIVLLVVPPHMNPDNAHATMMATARPGNTDAVDRLLKTTSGQRESRAFASTVRPRWLPSGRDSVIDDIRIACDSRLKYRRRRRPLPALAAP